MPKPTVKRKPMIRLTFALPEQQHKKLCVEAASKGISLAEYLRHILMAVADHMYSEY